jgi:Protein of unknown function (DUF3311)
MANLRPGQPEWQLTIPTRSPDSRPAQPPRSSGSAGAPFVDRPPAPAGPTRHPDPRTGPHTGGARHASGEFRTVPRQPTAAQPVPPPETGRGHDQRAGRSRWHWLLWIPILVPLMPAVYNHVEPTLYGVPFFYWGQLSFAFLATGVMAFVHRKVK